MTSAKTSPGYMCMGLRVQRPGLVGEGYDMRAKPAKPACAKLAGRGCIGEGHNLSETTFPGRTHHEYEGNHNQARE